MKFWDSSALVPLLAAEPASRPVLALYTRDPEVVVWWATQVECASAVARLERDGLLTAADAGRAFARLDALAASWLQVEPTDEIRETARRLLRVHPLRAADALQLAAAFVAAERRPPTMTFVTLDERLGAAAGREGFVLASLQAG
jgi:predicted nucleic acid-binding protein